MDKRRICVVTGTRADYGLLYWLMREIQADEEFELQLVVTGAHLSPEFGLTHKVIEEDGFVINEKVEMLLSSDTAVGVAKSLGVGTIGMADVFHRLHPDLLVVAGDRYEMLAAAQAALMARIPAAHIAGGDTTEGAFDEAIRHSISKMSHIHFVTNEISARRVRQLGENPRYVHNVGNPGIDYIARMDLLSRAELEKELDFKFQAQNFLVTFHPQTLDDRSSAQHMAELLQALESFNDGTGIIFTGANADTDGRIINRMIDDYAAVRPHVKVCLSLGQLRYLSIIAQADVVVGNSSSGLYEVPSFQKPTVNIGDRQKGRLQAVSVINCRPEAPAIKQAIITALHMDCSKVTNPYGDGNSSIKMLAVLKNIKDYKKLLKKEFYMVEKSDERE